MSRHPLHRLALLLALVLSLGPGTGLQVVAWVGMTWDLTPQVGAARAVAQVLSGEATCRICTVVRSLPGHDPQVAKLPPSPHLHPPLPVELPGPLEPWLPPAQVTRRADAGGRTPPALDPPPPRHS